MDALVLPPPGGDQFRGAPILVVSVTTFALAAVFVCLRMLGRILIVHQVGWDDFTIVLALMLTAVSTSFNVEQFKTGAGRHAYYLSLPQFFDAVKWGDLSQLMLIFITCITKVSICLFAMRIPNNKHLIRSLWVLIAALIFVNGACAITFFGQCRPLRKLWNPTVEGHCWSIDAYLVTGYIQGAFSILTDLICSFLPIAVLWNVQISRGKKIAICGLMATGLVATACSFVRISLFHLIKDDAADITWGVVNIEIWALFEQNISIIAANMPVMLPLYKYLGEKLPLSYSRVRSYLKRSVTRSETAGPSSKGSGFHRMNDKGDIPLTTVPDGIPSTSNSNQNCSSCRAQDASGENMEP